MMSFAMVLLLAASSGAEPQGKLSPDELRERAFNEYVSAAKDLESHLTKAVPLSAEINADLVKLNQAVKDHSADETAAICITFIPLYLEYGKKLKNTLAISERMSSAKKVMCELPQDEAKADCLYMKKPVEKMLAAARADLASWESRRTGFERHCALATGEARSSPTPKAALPTNGQQGSGAGIPNTSP